MRLLVTLPVSLSLCQRAMRGRSVSMETMSRGGAGLPTSLSGGGLAHISAEVSRGQRSLRRTGGLHLSLTAAVFCVSVQRQISGEETFRDLSSSAECRQSDGETQPEEVTDTQRR